MPLYLFSVFTSVCGGDTLLSGSCLLSTMVTASLQSSLSCGMRNLRHLKMPPKKITLNRPERVCFNTKVKNFLVLTKMKCQEWGGRTGLNQSRNFCHCSEESKASFPLLPILTLNHSLVFAPYLVFCNWGRSPWLEKKGPEMIGC